MAGGRHRRPEDFDPNKSDSDDVDFEPGEARSPRKSTKRSRPQKRAPASSRKRRGSYGGSDIDEDDDDIEDDDSVQQTSIGSESEEEAEMNEKTGRAVRKATKKAVVYAEDSASDIDLDVIEDSEDTQSKQKSTKRSRVISNVAEGEDDDELQEPPKKKKIITLKVKTGASLSSQPTRAAGNAARARSGKSAEPVSAGLNRRTTRAHTEEGQELIELSTSGKHAIRASATPEPFGRSRATRGSKSVKTAAYTIKEEVHETSSFEQQEGEAEEPINTMASENADVDVVDDAGVMSPENAATEADAQADDEDELGVERLTATAAPAEPEEDDDDDDEDAGPLTRIRATRGSRPVLDVEDSVEPAPEATPGTRRLRNRGAKKDKDDGSDFTPEGEGDGDDDALSASDASPQKSDADEFTNLRRGKSGRAKSKARSRRRKSGSSSDEQPDDEDEDILDVLNDREELKETERRERKRHRSRPDSEQIVYEQRQRRTKKKVDYSIKQLAEINEQAEESQEAAPTPARGRGDRGANRHWERPLYSTYGPFGGGGGLTPVIGGPWGVGATGGVDSDSSDDENIHQPNVGGNFGMTPTSANMNGLPGLLPGLGQAHAADGLASNAPNVGKVKSQKALADADPLGVDENVDFSKIGGLEGHIDQLKEMVQMPLLYPELFLKFHVTPPRGVLFHGPPGTGKTLLARALAASVGSGGRKITFYMRKGADALSKWVGEAERQLRLLFEEARKTQPSIIFFDEIDGLAPVRSSKQEQIHASIVSTLLALMDGMDGRGQVIVIGATNRPDNIDPALRRPGRFDREFYFPLPDIDGRKSIINIHTKDWGIDDRFKTQLAEKTKGYGGADLRALCTEAALNAMQRTYPQIYSSNEKLVVDPDKIKITAKDFMLSVKKIIPSSERSTSSGATPLPKGIEPLLRDQLKELEDIVDGLIPIKKKTTALQEAMYEQYEDDDYGFGRETMQQDFEKARVFRPRLLICGEPGMGQAYIGGALLNHFEGLHVQSFDLPTIYSDSARSAEAAIVQMFAEVKRHKPSVIYLPGIDNWYNTLPENVITTFLGLLKAIPPTDPVLVLGITDLPADKINPLIITNFFEYSVRNRYNMQRPSKDQRKEFFSSIAGYVRMQPHEFPEPLNRKKRKLEVLPIAPPPVVKPPTVEETKALKKRDHQMLNLLKIQIQPIVDQIKKKYTKFRVPVVTRSQMQWIYDEKDPDFFRPDVQQIRTFELGRDKTGKECIVETASGKHLYNMDIGTIEERLSNGFYARPQDFLADVKTFVKDAKYVDDNKRLLQAKEMVANVEVDVAVIEALPVFADCESLYHRQLQRKREREAKEDKARARAIKEKEEADAMIQRDLGNDLVRSDLTPEGFDEERAAKRLKLSAIAVGKQPAAMVTPVQSRHGDLSNGNFGGLRNINNGSAEPPLIGSDVPHMILQHMQPPHQQWPQMPSAPSNPSTHATGFNTQASQRFTSTRDGHDNSPSVRLNDTSTTTSGKKTSDGWSTQATNGVHPESFSPLDRPNNDSQLPDTQQDSQRTSTNTGGTQDASSNEDQWAHSQAHAIASGSLYAAYPSHTPSSGSQGSQKVPAFVTAVGTAMAPRPFRPTGIADILNDTPAPASSQVSSHKELIFDESFIDTLNGRLVDGSSGCSIEQLEQINRELMVAVWASRGDYNRNHVASNLTKIFNDTIKEIEDMQKVLQASQN